MHAPFDLVPQAGTAGAWLLAALGAGALGGLHCGAMCGPLVAFAAGGSGEGRWTRPVAGHALGRLLAYLALGAVAGTAGAALDVVGRLAHAQGLSGLVAGALIVAAGAIGLVRAVRGARSGAAAGEVVPWVPLPRLRRHGAATRGLLVGLASGVLPCGLLWMMLAAAAASGDPLLGAAVMGAFWLGGTPTLAALGLGARALGRRLGARAPVLNAALVLALGLTALVLRAPQVGAHLAAPDGAPIRVQACH